MSTTASTVHTKLRAEGFTCPSCVAKIRKQVGRLDGVEKVDVHFASSRIEVDHDPVAVGVEEIVDAVGRAGYVVRPAAF